MATGRGSRSVAEAVIEDAAAAPIEAPTAAITEPVTVPLSPITPPGGRGRVRGLLRDSANWKELRATPYGLRPMLVLGFLTFFQVFDTRAFYLAQVEITRDLNIEYSVIIGIVATVGTLAVFAALAAGWWADRHPRIPVVAAGAILSGAFAMLTGRSRTSLTFGLPRVADDVSDTASQVPRFSLLADYYPPHVRGKVFSVMGVLARAATVLSPLVAGGLIYFYGWRTTFVVLGGLILVMGLLVLRLREPVRGYMERRAMGADEAVAETEDEPLSFGEGWRTVMAVRTLRRTLLADVFSTVPEGIFGLFLPVYLAERYGLSALERGFVLAPAALFGVVGAYLGGGLVDTFIRRNPGRVLLFRGILEAISTIGLIGAALHPPIAIFVALYAFNAFGLSLTGPAASAVYSQVIPPSVRTQGLQVFGLATLPTTIIALPVFGVMRYEWGYTSVFWLLVPFSLIGALIAASAGNFFALDLRAALAASMANEEWRRAKQEGDTKLLVCRDVDVAYDGVQVLFGVDFDVRQGEIIALLGTNGAGKSTLLRAITGTQEASSGAIVFDGRDITHMPPHEIASRRVISMPGGRGVFPGLTVRENLMLGNWMNDDEADVQARLAEVLELFPILAERADEVASSMSGGEQQMLSLAQAFLCGPRLLVIDELSLGLSPGVVAQLLDVVRAIHAKGTTIIVVEQSVNVALTIAERAIFMEKGEVKFVGQTADLLRRPDILRAVYVKGTGSMTDASSRSQTSDRDRRALELGEARPILEVAHITRRFGGVTAVDDLSLSLREGEVLGVIGPNGSGKTTLFDIISGFQTPDAGSVRFDGADITTLSPEERAHRGLIRRFQDARLFPSLTVFETLLIALEERLEVKNPLLSAFGVPQARKAERRLRLQADRLIELFELGAYRDKFVKELSTGLRRIVDIACVLAAEPKVLLLDEPSSGIAQAEAEGLAPLLRRIRFETGCSILIIEHDMPLISGVSDELVALERGQFVVRGLPAEVLNNEQVIQSYLGTTEETVKRSGSL
jgi:branched-chain amino acid transport system ATP-binding protein